MKNIKIYQIKDINTPYLFREYREGMFDFNNYRYVGNVDVNEAEVDDMLEEAFEKGNNGQAVKEHNKMRSISVSDVLELDGKHYYANCFGFIPVA